MDKRDRDTVSAYLPVKMADPKRVSRKSSKKSIEEHQGYENSKTPKNQSREDLNMEHPPKNLKRGKSRHKPFFETDQRLKIINPINPPSALDLNPEMTFDNPPSPSNNRGRKGGMDTFNDLSPGRKSTL